VPEGTRVDRCFEEVRKERGDASAAAICQSSTGQNLHTGQPLRKSVKALRLKYRSKALENFKKGQAFDLFGEIWVITRVNKDGSVDVKMPYMDQFGKEGISKQRTFKKYDLSHARPVNGYWFPQAGPAKEEKSLPSQEKSIGNIVAFRFPARSGPTVKEFKQWLERHGWGEAARWRTGIQGGMQFYTRATGKPTEKEDVEGIEVYREKALTGTKSITSDVEAMLRKAKTSVLQPAEYEAFLSALANAPQAEVAAGMRKAGVDSTGKTKAETLRKLRGLLSAGYRTWQQVQA